MSKERVVNNSIAVFVILIGFIVLAGWKWDIPDMRMLLLHDNVSMKVNVAICLIFSGVALISFQGYNSRWANRSFVILSILILAIGMLSLSQDVFQYYAGIDELWVKDEIARSVNYPYPGRMSVASAICLCLEGIGFLCLAYKKNDKREKSCIVAQYCFHGMTILSFITIMGYIFSVPSLFTLPYMPIMAIHTSACFLLLSIGASLLNPSLGITNLFLADKLGSRMARRLFPIVTVAMLVLGSICVRLHLYGEPEVELGIMSFVFVFLLIALYFTARTAKWLNGIERERNVTDKTIRQLYGELEKKVAERSAALNTSEANLRTILDATDTIYALVDKNFNLVALNEAAREFVSRELRFEAHVGDHLPDYFPAERHKRVINLMNTALGGDCISYETQYVQPDGSRHWYDVKICAIHKGKKEVLGLMVALVDSTERKQDEMERERITNELIQRNKMLEQFTYMVSHNLRAPLANIMGLSGILMEQGLTEAEEREVTEGISASAARLDNVIKDLNNILQVKEGAKEKREQVSFSELVNEVKLLLAQQADHASIETDFEQIDTIYTLKSYMSSVFYNLISNAIKYRRYDVASVIEIKSIAGERHVILHFKDNGIGIDMERNADNIFGLYNRFHQHTEGKGMGLFMVKTQLESLGGSISVQSEVNKGTEFRIQLPA